MTTDLLTLPHTRLRVPPGAPNVSALRTMPSAHPGAYAAALHLNGRAVGTLHNPGDGPTIFMPHIATNYTSTHLADLAAACRTPYGAVPVEALVADLLVEEHRVGADIERVRADGVSLARLVAGLDGLTLTRALLVTILVTIEADRRDVATMLANHDALTPGRWWQLWDGAAWTDLAVPVRAGSGQRP